MPHVDLLELPYFEGISMDSLVSLVDLMDPKQFPAGAVIMREGDKIPPPLYIAIAGRVVISKQPPEPENAPPSTERSPERNLAELDSPTLFGEVELFCQLPPVATVRAVTPVSSFVLTRSSFERLFQAQHPALMLFIFNVARVACHRLAVADELLTTTLGGEDLVKARRAVFARKDAWTRTTGVFRRP